MVSCSYREKVIADLYGLLSGDYATIHTLAEQNAYFAVGQRKGLLGFVQGVRGSANKGVLDGVHGVPPGPGRRRQPAGSPWA
jgi:hypothetical protein